MELRVVDGRAVLVGRDTSGNRLLVEPATLALGAELTGALREWARVAVAVGSGGADSAEALVSVRGRQLAGRVAAVLGVDVRYADPVTGQVAVVAPAVVPRHAAARRASGWRGPAMLRNSAAVRSTVLAWRAAALGPAPWATGLTISAVAGLLVLLVMVTLSMALFDTSVLISLLANLVITAGLAPSVWLLGRLVVWRWIAYGLLTGLTLGWLVWLLGLLRLL